MTKHIVLFVDSSIYPQYQHIAIFKEGIGFWHMVDFMATGNIDVRVVTSDLVERLCKSNRFVEVDVNVSRWRTGTLLSISCVSLAKLYLGIKESAVLTPDELYRYLTGEKIGLKQKLLSPLKWLYLKYKL